jgi:hypothetical protein
MLLMHDADRLAWIGYRGALLFISACPPSWRGSRGSGGAQPECLGYAAVKTADLGYSRFHVVLAVEHLRFTSPEKRSLVSAAPS